MRHAWIRLVAHTVVFAVALLGTLAYLGTPLHRLTQTHFIALIGSVLGYPLGVLILEYRARFADRSTPGFALVTLLAVNIVLFVLVNLLSHPFARQVAPVGLACAAIAVCLYAAMPRAWPWAGLVSALSLAAYVPTAFQSDIAKLRAAIIGEVRAESWSISTGLYRLRATKYRVIDMGLAVRRAKQTGGGISELASGYLLAKGDGRLFAVAWDPQARVMSSRELRLRIPINTGDFAAATPGSVDRSSFRVADILVLEREGRTRLFATYHYWKTEERCSVMRVSYLEASNESLVSESPPGAWVQDFETSPCLPLSNIGMPFRGLENGGRMALLGEQDLLVTFGDHQFDGLYSSEALPQQRNNSYGKIFAISLLDNTSRLFSLGHRNPQGLHVDDSGATWSTEHGPRGGDELNRIEENGNYGWPLATYGAAYDKTDWPLNPNPGRHAGYTPPVFAWVPSIGVSNLVRSRGTHFDRWRDDLLVASLTDRSIWRVRLEGARAVYAERIPVGCRIRDLLQTAEGRLLLWCDEELSVVELARADPSSDGEALFAQCEGCHTITNNAAHGIGPDLRGLAGRPVAGEQGFAYSDALRELKRRRWTARELNAFLASPRNYAPGTTMQFDGIAGEAERAVLVEYLMSIRD